MNAPSTVELVLRMVVSVAIMGGLLWAVVRVGRGRRGRALLGAVGGGAKVDQIEVRARRQLNRSSSLSLVQVGSRTLLLGIGEHGVAVLAEGDDLSAVASSIEAAPSTPSPAEAGATTDPELARTRAPGASRPDPERTGVMDALRELTVRR
jgi:flagellar biogenesis protein FliO